MNDGPTSRFLRCRRCQERKDPAGGRHYKRIKKKGDAFIKCNEFICSDCVPAYVSAHSQGGTGK